MTVGILSSYVDRSNWTGNTVHEGYVAENVPWVWDSGAFSVFTGADHVTVEEHTAWVLAGQRAVPGPVRYIGFDVIGDADATFENYRMQRAAGAVVEPTIHYGAPLGYIDRVLDVADTAWLNLGGVVPLLKGGGDSRRVAAFVAAVRRRVPPEVKLHALGCTDPGVLNLVGLDGVDSTTWLGARRFGRVPLYDPARGRWYKLDVGRSTPRETVWKNVHRRSAVLRRYYGVGPDEVAARVGDDDWMFSLTVAAFNLLSEASTRRHKRSLTVYLAGIRKSEAVTPGIRDAIIRSQEEP